jgi:hypothetical protein
MRTRKEIKKEVLETPIGEIMMNFKDALTLAEANNHILATVYFANLVNTIENIVDLMVNDEIEASEEES